MNKTRRLYQLTPEEARTIDEMRLKYEEFREPCNEWERRFPKGSRVLVVRRWGAPQRPVGMYKDSGTVIGHTRTGIRVQHDPDPQANRERCVMGYIEGYSHKQLTSKAEHVRIFPGPKTICHLSVHFHTNPDWYRYYGYFSPKYKVPYSLLSISNLLDFWPSK